jgi:hypothetical protein
MPTTISDSDIETFLRRNASEYPSQISLIQAAVRLLWPKGAPTGGAERVVLVCLGHRLDGIPRAAVSPRLPAQLPQPH